jgi:16S rRNA (guanine527-N7)-methyltransferase
MNSAQILEKGILQLGMEVVPEDRQKMLTYLALLQKWNKVYSLTSIREPEQMVSIHLLDSIAVLPHLWPGRWLDVGSGAGLPGLVLALLRPEWAFTVLDSNSKKASFMQQAVIELGLRNVSVSCARVEDWKPEEKFDGIISRAFSEVAEFTTLTRHLLVQGGGWVAMKGAPSRELEHLPCGISVVRVIALQVPSLDAARCLVLLKEI